MYGSQFCRKNRCRRLLLAREVKILTLSYLPLCSLLKGNKKRRTFCRLSPSTPGDRFALLTAQKWSKKLSLWLKNAERLHVNPLIVELIPRKQCLSHWRRDFIKNVKTLNLDLSATRDAISDGLSIAAHCCKRNFRSEPKAAPALTY